MGNEKFFFHFPFSYKKKFSYLCTAIFGVLAQLARVFDWQSKGHRFDSDILHKLCISFHGFIEAFHFMESLFLRGLREKAYICTLKIFIVMVRRFFLIFSTASLLLVCQSCFAQETNSVKRNVYLQSAIQADIKREHFVSLPIDDAFSQKAFDEYLKSVIYSKLLFTQGDVDLMSEYRDKMDDEYLANRLEFFDLAVEIITRRTKEAERYCFTFLETPFDFTVNETVVFNSDSLSWAKDTTEVKDRWRKFLKYDVMTRVYNGMEDQRKALEKSDTITVKSLEDFEKEARTSVEKRYKDTFTYLFQNEDDDYLATYINAFLSVYDRIPNTIRRKTKKISTFVFRDSWKASAPH